MHSKRRLQFTGSRPERSSQPHIATVDPWERFTGVRRVRYQDIEGGNNVGA